MEAIEALAALAQETRLDVFRLLVRVGPEGLAAGAIADTLKVSRATLSFHLSQLERAGLLRSARQGRSIIYSADFDGMSRLLGFLTEDCCAGRPEICGVLETGKGRRALLGILSGRFIAGRYCPDAVSTPSDPGVQTED